MGLRAADHRLGHPDRCRGRGLRDPRGVLRVRARHRLHGQGQGLGVHRLLPVRAVAPGLGHRPGVHLGEPRGRRDHGDVGHRCGDRPPHGPLLLGRRDPGHAVPRRGHDALLLRLEGPLGPGVHAPPLRSRRAPRQRDLVRRGPAPHRRGQPLPARHDPARPAGLVAAGGAGGRRRDRAVVHHAGWSVGGDLQRGAAVLRHRGRAAPAHPARPVQRRRLDRSHRQDHRGRRTTGPVRRPSSS